MEILYLALDLLLKLSSVKVDAVVWVDSRQRKRKVSLLAVLDRLLEWRLVSVKFRHIRIIVNHAVIRTLSNPLNF